MLPWCSTWRHDRTREQKQDPQLLRSPLVMLLSSTAVAGQLSRDKDSMDGNVLGFGGHKKGASVKKMTGTRGTRTSARGFGVRGKTTAFNTPYNRISPLLLQRHESDNTAMPVSSWDKVNFHKKLVGLTQTANQMGYSAPADAMLSI